MKKYISLEELNKSIQDLDKNLSKRFIALDPKGYFLIKIDQKAREIIVELYSNNINSAGVAINPESGKPINCHKKEVRKAISIYKGRSAKDVGIKLTEGKQEHPISQLDHALYLGRELQRAEECLRNGETYIQD